MRSRYLAAMVLKPYICIPSSCYQHEFCCNSGVFCIASVLNSCVYAALTILLLLPAIFSPEGCKEVSKTMVRIASVVETRMSSSY